ncbi:protein lethal(2)denticleless [Hetaerina americana]|uniref:protein lethal(2)denticleless n=1 Tax=Hetaerina americana TaxID=62018 RepID=UPI003A7F5F29
MDAKGKEGFTYPKDSLVKRMGLLNSDHSTGLSNNPEGLSPVYCSKYCIKRNHEHLLALANEDGLLALHDTNLYKQSPLLVSQIHLNAVFDVAWMENDTKLVTASGDQSAVLWDLRDSQICKVSQFLGHSASVKTAAFRPNHNDIFATGARDGKIIVWDTRLNHNSVVKKPDNYIENAHGMTHHLDNLSVSRKKKTSIPPNSIISMTFQDEHTLITCGAMDGIIKVWDLRKNYSIYKRMPQPKFRLPEKGQGSMNGFTSLIMDPSKTRLFANCLDSNIYVFNATTFDSMPVGVYCGHSNHSFYVKCCMSPDGTHLLSGSGDNKAYIWSVTGSRFPVAVAECHLGEVTSVAWRNSDEPQFVTCSDDMTYGLWRIVSDAPVDEIRSKVIWVGDEEQKGLKQTIDLRVCPWKSICPSEKEVCMDHCVSPSTPRTIRKWVRVQERTPRTPSSDGSLTSPITPKEGKGPRGRNGGGPGNSRKGSKRKLEEFMAISEQAMEGEVRKVVGVSAPSILPVTPKDCLKAITPSASSPLSLPSPTQGLPNFVVDGISPHRHNCCSSAGRHKENVDWLTKLGQERRVKVAKTEQGEGGESKKDHRRQVNFEGRTKLCSSENLLRFFHSSPCDKVSE